MDKKLTPSTAAGVDAIEAADNARRQMEAREEVKRLLDRHSQKLAAEAVKEILEMHRTSAKNNKDIAENNQESEAEKQIIEELTRLFFNRFKRAGEKVTPQ